MANPGYVMQHMPNVVNSLMGVEDQNTRRLNALASLAALAASTGRSPQENPYRRAVLEVQRLLELECDPSFIKAGRLAAALSMISHAHTLYDMSDECVTRSIEAALEGRF